MKKEILLKPIRESGEDYDTIEKRIKALFKREIYLPLIKELRLKQKILTNAKDNALIEAIRSGQITFYRGSFEGRFNASISKELKRIGAKWDSKTRTFRLPQSSLPMDVRVTISVSEANFVQKMDAIDRKLATVAPERLAEKLKVADAFDRTLFRVEKDFQASVKGITVAPVVTDAQRARISAEWETNLQLYIKDFTAEETKKLRENIQKAVFMGKRNDEIQKAIQESFNVTVNKAKFLARQETSLLMTKYKQVRYQENGIDEYYWYHVTGTLNHPVRPMHKALGDAMDGGKKKIYRFSDPPIVDVKGEKKNPGQDYNCRCFARPLVRF